MDDRRRTCATSASSISLTALSQQNKFQEFLGTRLWKSDKKLLFLLLKNFLSVPDNPVQKMHRRYAAHLFKHSDEEDETHLLFQQSAEASFLSTYGAGEPGDTWGTKPETCFVLYCYCYLQRETYKTLYIYIWVSNKSLETVAHETLYPELIQICLDMSPATWMWNTL